MESFIDKLSVKEKINNEITKIEEVIFWLDEEVIKFSKESILSDYSKLKEIKKELSNLDTLEKFLNQDRFSKLPEERQELVYNQQLEKLFWKIKELSSFILISKWYIYWQNEFSSLEEIL